MISGKLVVSASQQYLYFYKKDIWKIFIRHFKGPYQNFFKIMILQLNRFQRIHSYKTHFDINDRN